MRTQIITLLLFLLPLFAEADEVSKLFDEANELYQSNEFSAAIEKYEAIEKMGYVSSELYFNLGNAYFKINRPGKSVLNYERALLHASSGTRDDINYNLALVKNSLPDEIEALSPFFLKKWKRNIHQFASARSWSILTLILFWAGIAGLVVWLLSKKREHKKIGFITGSVLLGLSLFFFVVAWDGVRFEKDTGKAVIMASEVDLRSAPDEVSTSIFLLHEGTSVELLDQIGAWYKVKLENGEQGWLPMKTLEKV